MTTSPDAEIARLDNLIISKNKEVLGRALASARGFIVEGKVMPSVGCPMDFQSDAKQVANYWNIAEELLLAQMKIDNLPIPDSDNREAYLPGKHLQYWGFGFSDFLKFKNIVEMYHQKIIRLYDFGGSTGRFFRHAYCSKIANEIWSSDFKFNSVSWCKKYFPADLLVFLNTYHPSLPISEKFFDVVTAFSVFTHIDELEISWLLEIERILAPGGLAYLTIHDENSWVHMSEHLRERVRKCPEAIGLDFGEPMAFDRKAFTFDAVLYNVFVFHSSDYIRRIWGRILDIVEIIPMHHNFQAVVIAKKKYR